MCGSLAEMPFTCYFQDEKERFMKLLQKLSLATGMACMLLTVAPVSAQTPAKVEKAKKEAAPTGPVDINTASSADLEAIKGIGPATAKKIIAGRPYSSV